MPTPDGQLKIGHDKHLRQRFDPQALPIPANAEDETFLSRCANQYLAGFARRPALMKPCIYTLSNDRHFLIDRHPEHANVLVFSCCSGHGFKYAPVYGEIAADLLEGKQRDDLAAFRLDRNEAAATRFSD
jgi:glycine/D-amino acid oxidase-like deaminating enzyme